MNSFTYYRAKALGDAVHQGLTHPAGKFLSGGTNLIDLMKQQVEKPSRLCDLNDLGLKSVEASAAGGLTIGASVTNSAMAYHPEIETRYPLLAEAILAGASPQIRNMATCGGNLLQRTRCSYFYDPATACNKREPASGCGAIAGLHRMHAIFGASDACIAVHPSDMCVALAALDASVTVVGARGERKISFADFHRLPGEDPQRDTTLGKDEIVIAVTLPSLPFSRHFRYVKVRDRSSYAFAIVSAGVGMEVEGTTLRRVHVAMGGVAHKPWRDEEAEQQLAGAPATTKTYRSFAEHFFQSAKPYPQNAFKVELGKRTLVRALEEAFSRGEQP